MIHYVRSLMIRLTWASVLFAGALWCTWGLFTFNPLSPSLFFASSTSAYINLSAYVTASMTWIMLYVLGLAAVLVPLVLCSGAVRALGILSHAPVWDRLVAAVGLACAGSYFASLSAGVIWHGQLVKGGLLGAWFMHMCGSGPIALAVMGWLALVSALIASRSSIIVALVWLERESVQALRVMIRVLRIDRALSLVFINFMHVCAACVRWLWGIITGAGVKHLELEQEQSDEMPHLHDIVRNVAWRVEQHNTSVTPAASLTPEHEHAQPVSAPAWRVPPLELLKRAHNVRVQDDADAQKQAHELERKLEQFSIRGQVATIKQGPVVTCFEYEPAPDTKLSRIVALQDDLALALKATSVRIQAPIVGTQYVGFEVARASRVMVPIFDIIASPAFAQHAGALPFVLGVTTTGTSVVSDLVRMPHVLVAGSTGSGKSVCLNTLLLSLLYRLSPDQLRLVLIDPKRLEFGSYANIAHLQFPVISQPRDAIAVLGWVAHEMDERYKILARAGVRNIADYRARAGADTQNMPYLVVIIDELADLMVLAGKQVEQHVVRIAQMARAAGIHLIVATQRPSVDVITGLIKVNFPSRIAFRVTSKVDSRTIIDEMGAEQLLGQGDMLFLDASSSTLARVHGAYVSDAEIERVTQFIRDQAVPRMLDMPRAIVADVGDHEVDEQLYQNVISFLNEVDEVSISLLQRRFRIGFNRSARIIEVLEAEGKIMATDGGKTRKVVRPE